MREARNPDEVARAFELINGDRVEALTVIVDPVFIEHRVQLAALAAAKRLPSVSKFRDCAEAGRLMAYGPDGLCTLES
jgi:putative tryptophan/tyrosine transport system substrate-binding protein